MQIDTPDIQEMFRSIRKPSLNAKLRLVLKRLDDPKIFQDSMARLGHGKRGKIDREAEWTKLKGKVTSVIQPILGD